MKRMMGYLAKFKCEACKKIVEEFLYRHRTCADCIREKDENAIRAHLDELKNVPLEERVAILEASMIRVLREIERIPRRP